MEFTDSELTALVIKYSELTDSELAVVELTVLELKVLELTD